MFHFQPHVFYCSKNACECMDLSITIMKEAIEKGGDIVNELDNIEKKYSKQSEICEKLYVDLGEEKMMNDMMACLDLTR